MWLYNNEVVDVIPEKFIGFVYIITNLINNKKYIGKKNFYFSKTKQVKGKKKRIKVESDWKEYFGSNEELKLEVQKIGSENFKREIIRMCSSKGEMSYFELKEQMIQGALESNDFYNTWVSGKIHKKHLTFLK